MIGIWIFIFLIIGSVLLVAFESLSNPTYEMQEENQRFFNLLGWGLLAFILLQIFFG
tara:strand:- start:157 stop:327 length:171 start_codon:yes stop_codon:yes gene_type:complete